MKASQFHLATLKEAPADAEIVSHRLMTRAGMIRKLAGGIYTYMPLGLRVIRRIEAIIREEMNRAGAIELLMPSIQPRELWDETGRWEKFGGQLLKIKDRKDVAFLSFSVDDDRADVAKFFANREEKFPVYMASALSDRMDVMIFPTKLIIDGRKGAPGRIRFKKEGVIEGDELERRISEVLKHP